MTRTRSRYAPDHGLTTRMVTTMFLIGLLYVVLVGVLLAVLRGAWPIILIFTGGLFIAQFWFSDRIAAFSMGAREVTPEEAPELHGTIDRICALADMPKPGWPSPGATYPTPSPPAAARRAPSSAPPPGSCADSNPRSWKASSRTRCRTSPTGTSPS